MVTRGNYITSFLPADSLSCLSNLHLASSEQWCWSGGREY